MLSPLELLAALPWLAITLLLPFVLRNRPRLERVPPVENGDGPLVSIVVPARNEAHNIGACVTMLLASGYERREIVVVDDHSTDGTGDIARILAERSDGAVRVIESQPLPEGWVGKCWACWQGYQAAHGDVLLFTDADTRHDERLLGHALGALRRTGAALVSVAPRQLMETFWERAVLPHIFLLISIRFRDLDRVNRATRPRDVIANGQFMLMPRDAYEAVGGHRAVRSEIVEDLHLAQRFVASGRRVYMANGERLMATRMYRSFGQIIEGWSKNLALGSRSTVDAWLRPFLPWALGALLLVVWTLPVLLLALWLVGMVTPAVRNWAIVTSTASLVFWVATFLRLRVPPLNALLFPLGGAVAGLLFLRSAIRGASVGWKGRIYDVDALAAARAGTGPEDPPASRLQP